MGGHILITVAVYISLCRQFLAEIPALKTGPLLVKPSFLGKSRSKYTSSKISSKFFFNVP